MGLSTGRVTTDVALETRMLALLLLAAGLAGCAGPRTTPYSYAPARDSYPAPGPAGDPWGPYITEASRRFSVPTGWIRAVMHQESGGHEYLDGQPITSGAGAMGLMQLMPATYADLQGQYGLGSDPYDPHDNIMAGTGYIRQMYDRYGSPGFLAAYNAGPARVDDYLAGEGGLPNETVNYVASIAPHLGDTGVFTSPVMVAPAPVRAAPPVLLASAASGGGGCFHDPDAAYDPAAPCEPPPPPVAAASCPTADPDIAFDPGAPCPPARLPVTGPSPVREAVWQPTASAIGGTAAIAPPSGMAPAFPLPSSAPAPFRPVPPPPPMIRQVAYAAPPLRRVAVATGAWTVQVGAFGQEGEARFATAMARDAAPAVLGGARELVQPVAGLGGGALWRARLAGLDRDRAAAACSALRGHAMPCMVVPPGS